MNDKIRLTFPSFYEKEAYTASSVHLTSSMARDPNEKSWKNIHDKEIRLTPNKLLITNNDGTSIELSDESGITVESTEDINIHTNHAVHMSGAEIVVEAGTGGIVLQQEQANIVIREKIQIEGKKIFAN